jgi:hypothetical protein
VLVEEQCLVVHLAVAVVVEAHPPSWAGEEVVEVVEEA